MLWLAGDQATAYSGEEAHTFQIQNGHRMGTHHDATSHTKTLSGRARRT